MYFSFFFIGEAFKFLQVAYWQYLQGLLIFHPFLPDFIPKAQTQPKSVPLIHCEVLKRKSALEY